MKLTKKEIFKVCRSLIIKTKSYKRGGSGRSEFCKGK